VATYQPVLELCFVLAPVMLITAIRRARGDNNTEVGTGLIMAPLAATKKRRQFDPKTFLSIVKVVGTS